MWKISRNIIFTRLSKKQVNYAEHCKTVPVLSKICPSSSSHKKRSSEKDDRKKHNFKQKEWFGNCEKMRFVLLASSLLEKASWLGTVTILCFNLHYKHVQFMLDCKNGRSHCILSRNVLAMPKSLNSKENASSYSTAANASFPTCDKTENLEQPDTGNSFEAFKQASQQYAAAIHISSGLSYLKSNKKKNAFHHFQKAARLGSSQGFYNLGLCYELGNGTKVNLSRAAFCYKQAAMRGHGLASFNLAVYFFKGMGGLPVDSETGKLLMKQAAKQDVPEAQLYIGLDCLENKNYSEAYQMFNMLAEKEILDGKYYLGICYENGWGVRKDEKLAARVFSEAALSGHSKSVLKLSTFYEDGRGDCDRDLDFSTALCQLLADDDNAELNTSLLRLKIKKSIFSNEQVLNKHSPIVKVRKALPNSISVPELASYQNEKYKNGSEAFIAQSYLGLITPLLAVKSKAKEPKKCSFYLGEDNQESKLIGIFHSHLQISMPKIMAAGL